MEKLSSKKSIEGADTVQRGSVRAPKGFSNGKPEGAQPQRFCSQWFARGKFRGSPHTVQQHIGGTRGTFLREQLFHSAPRIFNSLA